VLKTVRYPLRPRSVAIWSAAKKRSAVMVALLRATPAAFSVCKVGINKTCVGACGFKSLNATTFSLRNTISAGMSPSIILQKMQLGSKAT